MRLIYVHTVYGGKFRINGEDLEQAGKLPFISRYNNRGEIAINRKTGNQEAIHRGNIVGPWPGCVNDLPAFERRTNRIAAGLERA